MTLPAPLSPELLVQMRLAHLGMVQNVIGRMSTYSTGIKTVCVTVAGAALALTSGNPQPQLLQITLGIIAVFAVLDAYYLGAEREFREFYNEVTGRNLSRAAELGIGRKATPVASTFWAMMSISVAGFYAPVSVLMYLAWQLVLRANA